jgi:hypothetical protein
MKNIWGFLLPIFLLTAGACKKPVLESTDGTIPPLVLSTAIEDSLPAKMITALNLEGITGLKIQYYSGLHNSYFEYDAEKDVVLDAISALPFPMTADISDTRCRTISFQTLNSVKKNISSTELTSASHFWDTVESEYEVFECIKPPYKHILQVETDGKHILHRIELLKQS